MVIAETFRNAACAMRRSASVLAKYLGSSGRADEKNTWGAVALAHSPLLLEPHHHRRAIELQLVLDIRLEFGPDRHLGVEKIVSVLR